MTHDSHKPTFVIKNDMFKPILCLDFDGVVHSYISGWSGPEIVSDPPVEGAFEFIQNAQVVFNVCIYSSRSAYNHGIVAMRDWFYLHAKGDPTWISFLQFPRYKPTARVTLDDRAITFTGKWPEIETLYKFRPWNDPR